MSQQPPRLRFPEPQQMEEEPDEEKHSTLPSSRITVQDLNLRSQEMLRNLVSDLEDQYGRKLQESFDKMRLNIRGRELYVLFEPSLNCNPLSDHQIPKDVLPLFEPYILQAEGQLLELFDETLPKLIFDYFLAILSAQIAAQSSIQLKYDQTQEELSKFETETAVQADIIRTLEQAVLQEKQKHLKETQMLREQLTARQRYPQQYQPDFADVEKYEDVLQIPDISVDLEQFKQKTAKEIRLDSRPLIEEIKELKTMNQEMMARLRLAENTKKDIIQLNEDIATQLDSAQSEIEDYKKVVADFTERLKVTLAEHKEAEKRELAIREELNDAEEDVQKMVLTNRALHEELKLRNRDDASDKFEAAIERSFREEAEISEHKNVIEAEQSRIQFLELEMAKQRGTSERDRIEEQEQIINDLRLENCKIFEEMRALKVAKERNVAVASEPIKVAVNSQLDLEDKETQTQFLYDIEREAELAKQEEHETVEEPLGNSTAPIEQLKAAGNLGLQGRQMMSDSQIVHERNVSFGSRKGGRMADIRLIDAKGNESDVQLNIDLNSKKTIEEDDGARNSPDIGNTITSEPRKARHFRTKPSAMEEYGSVDEQEHNISRKEGTERAQVHEAETVIEHSNHTEANYLTPTVCVDEDDAINRVVEEVTTFQTNTVIIEPENSSKLLFNEENASPTTVEMENERNTSASEQEVLSDEFGNEVMQENEAVNEGSCPIGDVPYCEPDVSMDPGFEHAIGLGDLVTKDQKLSEEVEVELQYLNRDEPYMVQLADELEEEESLKVEIIPEMVIEQADEHKYDDLRLEMEAAAKLYEGNCIHTIEEEAEDEVRYNMDAACHDLDEQVDNLKELRELTAEGDYVPPTAVSRAVFVLNQLLEQSPDKQVYTGEELEKAVNCKLEVVSGARKLIEQSNHGEGENMAKDMLIKIEKDEMKEQLMHYLMKNETKLEEYDASPCFSRSLLALQEKESQMTLEFRNTLMNGIYSPYETRKIVSAYENLSENSKEIVEEVYSGSLANSIALGTLERHQVDTLFCLLGNKELRHILCDNLIDVDQFLEENEAIFEVSENEKQIPINIFSLSSEMKECIETYYQTKEQIHGKIGEAMAIDLLENVKTGKGSIELCNALKTLLDTSAGGLLTAKMTNEQMRRVSVLYKKLNQIDENTLSQDAIYEAVCKLAQLELEVELKEKSSREVSKAVTESVGLLKTELGAKRLLDEGVVRKMAAGKLSRENSKLLHDLLYEPSAIRKLSLIEDKKTTRGLVNVLYNPELQDFENPQNVRHLAKEFYDENVEAALFGKSIARQASEKCEELVIDVQGSHLSEPSCSPFEFCLQRSKIENEQRQTKDELPSVRVFNYQRVLESHARKPVFYQIEARNSRRPPCSPKSILNAGLTADNISLSQTKKGGITTQKSILRAKYFHPVNEHPTLDISGLLRVEALGHPIQETPEQGDFSGAATIRNGLVREPKRGRTRSHLTESELEIVLKLLGNGYVPGRDRGQGRGRGE